MQVGPDDVLERVLDPGDRLLVYLVVGYREDSGDLAAEGVLLPLVLQHEADRRPYEFRPPCETEGLLNLIHVPDHLIWERKADYGHFVSQVNNQYKCDCLLVNNYAELGTRLDSRLESQASLRGS